MGQKDPLNPVAGEPFMQFVYEASTLLSILLFLFYGVRCLFSGGMIEEFERFGLSRYRRLTGALEIFGALGLAAGQLLNPVLLASSAGLALLMALGVATRIRVRDPLPDILPALVLGAVNVFIFLVAAGMVGGVDPGPVWPVAPGVN